MGPTEVVLVESEGHKEMGGFVRINKEDFDPKKHKLFVEKAKIDIEKATLPQVKKFLQESKVAFSKDASEDELRMLAMEHMTAVK